MIFLILFALGIVIAGFIVVDGALTTGASYVGAGIAAIGMLVLIFALALVLLDVASAHDHNRPELDSWYKSLKSPGRGPCCDGSEAQSLVNPDWETNGSHYRVRLEGDWIDVPDDAVITEPNLAGETKVWPMKTPDGWYIRCFMPGPFA